MGKAGETICPDGFKKQGAICVGEQGKDPDGEPDGKCPAGYTKQDNLCVGKGDDGSEGGKVDGDSGADGDGKDKGKFGGSCGSGFQCEGDVLQCTMAREQHARNCSIFDNASAESDLYGLEKGKDGDQTGDLPGSGEVDLAKSLDRSAIISGSCMSDFSVDVLGTSITIEMSRICPFLDILGYLLMTITGLICYRIIARG